jgi:hypothetical protein
VDRKKYTDPDIATASNPGENQSVTKGLFVVTNAIGEVGCFHQIHPRKKKKAAKLCYFL